MIWMPSSHTRKSENRWQWRFVVEIQQRFFSHYLMRIQTRSRTKCGDALWVQQWTHPLGEICLKHFHFSRNVSYTEESEYVQPHQHLKQTATSRKILENTQPQKRHKQKKQKLMHPANSQLFHNLRAMRSSGFWGERALSKPQVFLKPLTSFPLCHIMRASAITHYVSNQICQNSVDGGWNSTLWLQTSWEEEFHWTD